MVSINAFQALDPGSIPGQRTFFFNVIIIIFKNFFSSFHLSPTPIFSFACGNLACTLTTSTYNLLKGEKKVAYITFSD